MTPGELVEIRERADRLRSVPAGVPERDRDRLLAYVEELKRKQSSSMDRIKGMLAEMERQDEITSRGMIIMSSVLKAVEAEL